MAVIVVTNANGSERRLEIGEEEAVIGRATDAVISLEGANVSRKHARICRDGSEFLIEDLGSSNGTYLNGSRLTARAPLRPSDSLRIGGYVLRLEDEHRKERGELTIQRRTLAATGNQELYRENTAQKLQIILELSHALANTLEVETLLSRFLEKCLQLFPKAERALAIFIENDSPVVRQMRERGSHQMQALFSRTLIREVIEKGVAVLAEDVQSLDQNLSLNALGVRSLLCVPLSTLERAVFGVIQLDRFRTGQPFTAEDLNLLTAVALQFSVALDKAKLHEKVLAQERIARELALAREIQLGFLPPAAPSLPSQVVDLCGDLTPAEEVSGDYYDFIVRDESHVVIVVADVSGKGMPAALFMSMVRALVRQAVLRSDSPAEILKGVNRALALDNSQFMFVTIILAVYNPSTARCIFSRGGHPAPLLRRTNGEVFEVESDAGCLVGIDGDCARFYDSSLQMEPGDTLFFYTDGLTEAANEKSNALFGCARLIACVRLLPEHSSLAEWIMGVKKEVRQHCGASGPQDDLTLVFLRHSSAAQRQ